MPTHDGPGAAGQHRPGTSLPPTAASEGAAGQESKRQGETVPTGISPRDLPPRFGRYEIRKKLGDGGMGSVYLAYNTELRREEALKVPHLGDGVSPTVRERFLREARLAAGLDHPNLCPVYHVDVQDGICYLTMRYLKGRPLAEQANRPMPPRRAVEIVATIAGALAAAHEQGVVHRDLKPGNVMMVPGTGPVVMDFGLAKQFQLDDKLTQKGVMLGTPAYMPPEQIEGDLDRIGPASDVYSLGVILYQLLTGRLPFEGPPGVVMGQIVYVEPRPPSALLPGLDRRLDALCGRAMVKQPEQRYPSMRAFAAALHGYLQSLPTVQEVVAVQPDTGVRTPPSTLSGTGRPPTHKPAGVSTVLPVPDSAAKPARVPSCGCVAGAIVCALLLIGLVAGSGGVIYWLKVHKTDDASGLAKKTDGTDANPGVPLGVGAQDLQRLGFGRPRIVLVGIDRYADPTITPRIHAEADARSLYDLFTNPDYLGVPKDQVRLLLGSPDEGRSSEPAGRDNVLGALQWLSANAGEDDLTIVGLFVQGASLGEYADQVCYLAADSTLRGRQSNAIAAVEVGAALERLKSRHLCVFLDVNFNAATARGPALPEVLSVPSFREFLGDDGTPRHGSIPGRNLFLANQCLAPSLELPDHGLLARLVGDGLRGAADHDGYEPDGYVTLDELRRYVQREGRELARRQGISRRDRNQLPAAYGWNSSFALTQNPAVMPRVRQRLARIDALAAGARISPDVAVEARVLLTRMPRSEGRRELRKEYQKLADGMTSVENFLPVREQLVASMRVSPEEAGEFANKVLGAVDLVREHYVKELDPADMVGWTIRRLYQALDEELPSDFAARLRGLKGKDRDEWKRLLTHVRASLGKREDLADGKDVDLALEALVAPLDTTTSYYSKSQKAVIDEDTKGNLVGIGIEVRKDPATDLLAVVTPIKGGPAYRAGLQAGDRIITIIRETDGTGKPLDRADVTATKGRTLGELIDKLRGQPGTPVTLTVERDGADQPLRYTVKRAVVGMESVYGWQRRKDDTWDWWLDRQGGIGYVRLRTFMPNTPAVLEQALRELKATPGALRGLVLDLRSNPGGVLNGAIEVSDLLIDDGLIVTVRPRTGAEQAHRGKHEGSYLNFPIVCLVNGETASGAEIVAACLQDHKRAVIVGERTFGKGNVDSYYVYGEAQFRITTSLFYRPSGKIIDKANATDAAWGVEPDEGYEARLTPKERAEVADGLTAARAIPRRDRPGAGARPAFRDRQLEKAIEYLRRRKN